MPVIDGCGLTGRFRDDLDYERSRQKESGYLDYVYGITEPDLVSTILVEIPSYNDPQILWTVRSAVAMAANPDRIRFAVCLQDDDTGRLADLRQIPGVRVKHYALEAAPGACAARYECNLMYEGEDFVFHTDAHMRFARFWDVAIIDQWRLCGSDGAVVTEYAKPFGADLLGVPVDDGVFTGLASVGGRLLTARFFPKHEPEASLRAESVSFRGPEPVLGAFIAAGWLFCRGEVDAQVPVDPKMHFFGDEMGMCVRYWTHGFDIYQPGVEFVFHLYAGERSKADYHNEAAVRKRAKAVLTEDGISRGERERRRMESLLGVHKWNGVDLGPFGLGMKRTLAEYQEFCGVDFRRMQIRNFAVRGLFGKIHDGADDMGFYDWEAAYERWPHPPVTDKPLDLRIKACTADRFMKSCGCLDWHPSAALAEAIRTWMEKTEAEERRVMDMAVSPEAVNDTHALDRFRAKLRAESLRVPGSGYLGYLKNLSQPDLDSMILVEIPAYCDPELLNTVYAARSMAACPDRIRFAVCLQDDDVERLEALYAVPGCRVKYYPSDEAPGLCAARYDCQQLYDGEDFVFHVDSHMRFARFWDVAMIAQWQSCGNEKAVISDYSRRLDVDWLSLPVNDSVFTKSVELCCGVVNASFFGHYVPELRLRVSKLYQSDKPLLGAFISGHCLFGRPSVDRIVPSDPKMDFVADEHSIAARLWTHGFDIYHGNVRCIYHLYNRAEVGKKLFSRPVEVLGSDGLSRWERQTRRLEKLLGMYDRQDVDLAGFDLGTVRSLSDYQMFAGVDFRDLTIREFAAHGRFDVEHSVEDMRLFDWMADHGAGKKEFRDEGTKIDVGVRPDAADMFLMLCRELHLCPQTALTEALRQWTDNRLRGRFCQSDEYRHGR